MVKFLAILATTALLSSCGGTMVYQETPYGGPPPYSYGNPYQPYAQPYPQPYAAPPPSYGPGLSRLQQDALVDGCQLRYSGIPQKLRACLNMGANWQEALAQGCQRRYSGIPHKLRECMQY
jgi:hypothetical protein